MSLLEDVVGLAGSAASAAWSMLPTLRAVDTGPVGTSRPVYTNAAQGRRTVGFYAPDHGPMAALMASGDELRRRSRAMMRNNPWAFNAREQFQANAVGTGVTPKFLWGSPEWQEKTLQAFEDSTEEIDATGLGDFYGTQKLVAREVFEAGEVFVRLRFRRPEDTAPDGTRLLVPFQVQVIQSEHCPFWYNAPLPNGYVRAGIQYDSIGRRQGYWMYPDHPGELAGSFTFEGRGLKFIPANQILHIFDPLNAEAERGAPWLARVLLRLWGLDEYDDAELDGQRISAAIGGVITLLDPDKAGETLGELHEKATSDNPFYNLEPGTFPLLGPGEDIKQFERRELGTNYAPFHEQNLRAVAAGAGLTYELLTGDLSRVNYSSLRAGTVEFRRRCEQFIHLVLARGYCTPVARIWLEQAILAGVVDVAADVYRTNLRDVRRIDWMPQGWSWVDPGVEVDAALKECRGLINSSDRVIAERLGISGRQLRREVAEINADLDKRGLVAETDPRTTRLGGGSIAAEANAKAGGGDDAPRNARPAPAKGDDKPATKPGRTGTDDK